MVRSHWSRAVPALLLTVACDPATVVDTDAPQASRASATRQATDRGFRPNARAGFSLALPGAARGARFDEHGARLGALDGEHAGLVFRTARWGREGVWTDAEPVDAALVACPGDCVERIEYARPGMTEWWRRVALGVEFGFTVEQAPVGEGSLAIEVAVDGATDVRQRGAGAAIEDGDGRVWALSGVAAWDARGVSLASSLAVVGQALVLRVDIDGARMPITIDPIVTTPSTVLTFPEPSVGDRALVGAGDVNGDGFRDVILGHQKFDSPNGAVYLYLGSAMGVSAVPATTLKASIGAGVAGAGDVNGDGYDDVIVARSNAPWNVDVFHGSAAGISAAPAATLPGSDFWVFRQICGQHSCLIGQIAA